MSGFHVADTELLRGVGDLLGTTIGRLSELASDAEAFRSDFSGRVNGLFDATEGLMDRYRTDVGGLV